MRVISPHTPSVAPRLLLGPPTLCCLSQPGGYWYSPFLCPVSHLVGIDATVMIQYCYIKKLLLGQGVGLGAYVQKMIP
jgi:hypothetical protein